MTEPKSDCCGAGVIPHPQEHVCAKCGLSCIPIEDFKPRKVKEERGE